MGFSEVLLRLGCSLVGWMTIYAHAVWLAALGRIGCGPDGTEMHALLLGMAPLTVAMSLLPHLTRPLTEVQATLRWLALPLAALLPFELASIWMVGTGVVATGAGLCGASDPPTWQLAWVPAQVAAVVIASGSILTAWIHVAADRRRLSTPGAD